MEPDSLNTPTSKGAQSTATRKYTVPGLATLVAIVLLWIGISEYIDRQAHEFDAPLIAALEKVSTIQSYVQYVDTSTVVSDRPLRVYGWYTVDHTNRTYSAFSTTTLQVPEGIQGAGGHDFTHDNIAIGDTVYVKVDTKSEFLKPSINDSHEWQRFDRNDIPDPYKNIAIAGPILDNLRVFANSAEHLELIRKFGLETIEDKILRHYRFKLKSIVPKESTVGALSERLGSAGIIDIWTDDETATIQRMVFTNEPYTSTTSLSSFNTAPPTTPPPGFD